ncbi:MAG: histidine ammonia-lyase [Endozoicomonas sp.]
MEEQSAKLTLQPGQLTFSELRQAFNRPVELTLPRDIEQTAFFSRQVIDNLMARGETLYGINTGFGQLANTRISASQLESLQRNIVLSHAAGTGDLLVDDSVRLMMLLKLNSLARGYSGVRMEVLHILTQLLNQKIYPCIPSQGSVGASGDLAPLAHMTLVMLGEGEARYRGSVIPGAEAMRIAGLRPLQLAPKEGLALLNGTQASTALALRGLFQAQDLLSVAILAGCLSLEAAMGSRKPFDYRIHAIKGHPGQIDCAAAYRSLLDEQSEISLAHQHCEKVQDPYSLRCQPQVMGACLTQIRNAANILHTEANAVSDNPLIFYEEQEVLSGGNFHAETVAMAADNLALALAEIGALSERRTALLVDSHLSGLPPFLVENGGVNSGFMIAQVTAAALASENKSLAHPVSIDSLPTSANQEDHVSMATYAARRLHDMAENTLGIIAIEFLAAAQGLDFRRPLQSSPTLEKTWTQIRSSVPFYDKDRYFAEDIEKIKKLTARGAFNQLAPSLFDSY